MFRSLAALCLVAAPLLTAFAADEPVATEFVSKEGKFKATFPTKPETTEAKPKGGFAVTTTTAIPKPGSVFTVTYFDLPIDIPADKAKETLVALAGGSRAKPSPKRRSRSARTSCRVATRCTSCPTPTSASS